MGQPAASSRPQLWHLKGVAGTLSVFENSPVVSDRSCRALPSSISPQAVVFLRRTVRYWNAAAMIDRALTHSTSTRSNGLHGVDHRLGCLPAQLSRNHAVGGQKRRSMATRGFGTIIRIKHRSVSSGLLHAATSHVHQSFHEKPEHELSSLAVSSISLSHWMARRSQRIYPDKSG